MATTPPPTAATPQQQPPPQGTTPPKKRRAALFVMGAVIVIGLFTIFHQPGPQPPRRRASDLKDTTASEEQIAAAMAANQAEIQQAKAAADRQRKKQEEAKKTVAFEKKLAMPTVLPAGRGLGSLGLGGGSGAGHGATHKNSPSTVFDLSGDRQQSQEIVAPGRKTPQQVARQMMAESRPALRDIATESPYRTVPEHPAPEADSPRESSPRANLLAANPDWPTVTLPEGAVIEGVLINRLNGAEPGPVKVMVTTAVYLPGTRKLVFPMGTTVLGEAKRVTGVDQERLAVMFHRALVDGPDGTPYGVSFDAPALDQAGSVALHGKVNHHYVQIFGASLAVGAIGGLVNIGNTYGGAGGYDTGSDIRRGIGSEMGMNAQQILSRFLNRLPTVVIHEGTRVKIILMSDLSVPLYPEYSEEEER